MTSVNQISEEIAREIFDKLVTMRRELNKTVHVLEITDTILKKNFPGLENASDILESIKTILHELNGVKLYNGETEINGYYYLAEGNNILLIARSYDALSRLVRRISRHPKLVKSEFGSTLGSRGYRRNFDLGHIAHLSQPFGDRGITNTVAGRAIEITLLRSGNARLEAIGREFLNELEHVHMDYVSDFRTTSLANNLKGKFVFVYTVPQSRQVNQALAILEKKLVAKLRAILPDLTASPSIVDDLIKILEDSFSGKKSKVKLNKHVVKRGSFDKQVKLNVRKPGVKFKGKKTFVNNNLLSYINMHLHEQIKKNMGDGSSKEILNYRTGRFARSAKATNLITRADALQISYTYMRFPYDVFLPGGKLYKPGRDPRGIIGYSIRELIQKSQLAKNATIRTNLV